MKYRIGNILLLSIVITYCANASWPAALKDGDFFLYNKRSKPIYYALSIGDEEPAQFTRVNAQRCSLYIPVGLEKEIHLYISLDREPQVGEFIDHYTFTPGTFRFIYLKTMPEASTWRNSWHVDGAREITQEKYVLWMYTNYNPTITSAARGRAAGADQPLIERITYNGHKEQDRLARLKVMTVDQLEEQLSTIATLLGVLHARKNNDSEAACKQLEQERTWIRGLLAQYYKK